MVRLRSRQSASASAHQRIAVRSQHRIVLLDPTEIESICAANNDVKVHVPGSSYVVHLPLRDIEKKLPKHQFLRTGRSHLVNLGRIKEIRSKSHGDALILLKGGTVVPLSRSYRHDLLRCLEHAC
jgi:DNA-binding LytR/AlgR family response regulator